MPAARIALAALTLLTATFVGCAKDSSSPGELRKLAPAAATFPGALELERKDGTADAFVNSSATTLYGTEAPVQEVMDFYEQVAESDGWTKANFGASQGESNQRDWTKANFQMRFSVPILSDGAKARLGPHSLIFQVSFFATK